MSLQLLFVISLRVSLLGLDVNKCHILEMACIVTEGNLEIVEEVSRRTTK